MSDKVQTAEDTFRKGFNCAQAVVSTFADEHGLDRDAALRLAGAFGAGMTMGETCGAVTGAYMVIGLQRAKADPAYNRGELAELVAEFNRRFEERRNSVVCRVLLGCDPSTPEGRKEAIERGLFKTMCAELVRDAAEIVQYVL